MLGTPAEEGGGGKVLMLERGAFDGLDAAMMVHPAAAEMDAMPGSAVSMFDVSYRGGPRTRVPIPNAASTPPTP